MRFILPDVVEHFLVPPLLRGLYSLPVSVEHQLRILLQDEFAGTDIEE